MNSSSCSQDPRGDANRRRHALRREARCTRRELMRIGGLTAFGLGVGGLGLADLFALRRAAAAPTDTGEAAPRSFGTARACILIWLDGGPSHLETFDPKPDAPAEVRGPLETIGTRLPGVRIAECLPRTAALLDKLAVIRSVTSPLGEHNFGAHYLLTGHKPTPVLEYPALGGIVAHTRPSSGVLPPHVAIPDFQVGGGGLTGNGFLPTAAGPFSVGGDPARPDFQVRDLDFSQGLNLSRLERRRAFVNRLDRFRRDAEDATDGPTNPDLERAYRLLTSEDARSAFRLSDEPAAIRQRYGGRTVGQCCLLARRLVERGVPFVTVNHRGWDTHQDLYTRLKEGFTGAPEPGVGLLPTLDLALTGLVQDLEQRGLLQETLVVVMGEFGRTPKLNTSGGRDHWPRVFSVLLAGGGVPGGQVIGASDATAESPQDRPVTPSDLAATVHTLLGIDPRGELTTADGRPVRITPEGAEVIRELAG